MSHNKTKSTGSVFGRKASQQMPTRTRNAYPTAGRSSSGLSNYQSRGKTATLVESEKPKIAQQILNTLEEVDSKSQEGQMSLADVAKRYENRGGFYKDFYKNVPSYKNFDAKAGYEDFMTRKV